MKKRVIILLMMLTIILVSVILYKAIAGNEIKSRTIDYLEEKGYTAHDISSIEINHSFINKLLSFNEWRIFVVFKSEPDIVFAFTYRNEEIIRQGVSSNSLLEKEEILSFEKRFDAGDLRD